MFCFANMTKREPTCLAIFVIALSQEPMKESKFDVLLRCRYVNGNRLLLLFRGHLCDRYKDLQNPVEYTLKYPDETISIAIKRMDPVSLYFMAFEYKWSIPDVFPRMNDLNSK